MQADLDANYPDLDIQIIGMNQITHDGGNALTTDGNDIAWLQDEDKDGDGKSDVWLNSWSYVYRDVVIVDSNNVPVTSFNLTTKSLAEDQNYQALRQLFLDAAATTLDLADDAVAMRPDTSIDIAVLANDGASPADDLMLENIEVPSLGTAELVASEFPRDMKPFQAIIPPLLISEVKPGSFIELFHTGFDERALDTVSQVIVSGDASVALADLGGQLTAPPRSYVELPWPAAFSATPSSGEVLIFRDDLTGFQDGGKLEDFVAWGNSPAVSRLSLAQAWGKWSGLPADALSGESIQRLPATPGAAASWYDTQSAATPDAAYNDEVQELQVVRYTPPQGFEGEVRFNYLAGDSQGKMGRAELKVTIADDARPWQNPDNHLDMNGDGVVTVLDALVAINYLNDGLRGSLPLSPTAPLSLPPFLDCDGSNSLDPIDALLVINFLTADVGEAEPIPFAGVPTTETTGMSPFFAANWAGWVITSSPRVTDDRFYPEPAPPARLRRVWSTDIEAPASSEFAPLIPEAFLDGGPSGDGQDSSA